MTRRVPDFRGMRTSLQTANADRDGAWREHLVVPRMPARDWRRGRASAREAKPMGAMQRVIFLVRVMAVMQAVMRSPIGRRVMALNRKAADKSQKRGPRLALARSRAPKREGGSDMRFIVWVLVGIVIGAAGAVIYSVKSGRDLREALDDVRADLEKRDMDAFGSRLEARFTAMQAQLEERMGQVKERASGGADVAVQTAEAVTETAADAGSQVVEAAGEAAEDAKGAVEDVVAEARQES